MLTHTLTHTGKRMDGAHGAKSFRPRPFCSKNARKALYTNGWRAFYHLVRMRSAVRIRPAAPKSIESFGFRCFFVAKMLKTARVKMWGNRLTHTVTHTRKCPDRPKEYRRGGFASSPVFLSSFCSHDLRHEAAHGLCGLVLLLPCCVGVGAECEARIVVAQHAANGFDVHAVLQG